MRAVKSFELIRKRYGRVLTVYSNRVTVAGTLHERVGEPEPDHDAENGLVGQQFGGDSRSHDDKAMTEVRLDRLSFVRASLEGTGSTRHLHRVLLACGRALF